jgi:hypothetical protein
VRPRNHYGLVAVAALTACAGRPQDVLSARDAGDGDERTFAVGSSDAWKAARAALLWSHAAPASIRRSDDCLLGETTLSAYTWGAAMLVCIQAVGSGRTFVRAVVSRRVPTGLLEQSSEEALMRAMAKAVQLLQRGVEELPPEEP